MHHYGITVYGKRFLTLIALRSLFCARLLTALKYLRKNRIFDFMSFCHLHFKSALAQKTLAYAKQQAGLGEYIAVHFNYVFIKIFLFSYQSNVCHYLLAVCFMAPIFEDVFAQTRPYF